MVGLRNKQVTNQNKIWQQVYDEAKQALRVIAEIVVEDIQIGAVEIKNATTDDRLIVHPDGTITIRVQETGAPVDYSTDDSGDGLFPLTGAEDVVLSIPVAAGNTLRIAGWDYGASKACTFKLKVMNNAVLQRVIRTKGNSGSNPTNSLEFPTPITVTGGANITVEVTVERNDGNSGGFGQAGVNGYIIS
jgi:hypothetical protein